MSNRLIGFDRLELDPGIKEETDSDLVVSAIIAREIVQKYPGGRYWKPAEELEKAAWTAENRWLTTEAHPNTMLLTRASDIKGRVEHPEFVKSLIDPKTRRPIDRGIKADLRFFKSKLTPQFIADIKDGKVKEVSIGFTYDEDRTQGEWIHEGNHEPYDAIQKNIFIDHVAAGVVKGRCPVPYCGIGVDSLMFKIAADPWEEGEKYIRSGHRDPESFDPNSLRTIDITEGIKAVVGCPRGKYENGKCTVGTEVQSYLFDTGKFSLEQAKAWFEKHRGDSVDAIGDCPICVAIESIGVLEASKRLASAFGMDAVKALQLDAEGSAREKAKKEQEARASKYGIAVKEGGNVTKPSEFENIPDDEFADPVNYRYQMDAAHVQAAWAYISQPDNQKAGGYSSEEWSKMQENIKAAMKKHGHQVEGDSSLRDEIERSRRLIG